MPGTVAFVKETISDIGALYKSQKGAVVRNTGLQEEMANRVMNEAANKAGGSTMAHAGQWVQDKVGMVEMGLQVAGKLPFVGPALEVAGHAGGAIAYAVGGGLKVTDKIMDGKYKEATNIAAGTVAGTAVHAAPYSELVSSVITAGNSIIVGSKDLRTLAQRADDFAREQTASVTGGETVQMSGGMPPTAPGKTPEAKLAANDPHYSTVKRG